MNEQKLYSAIIPVELVADNEEQAQELLQDAALELFSSPFIVSVSWLDLELADDRGVIVSNDINTARSVQH